MIEHVKSLKNLVLEFFRRDWQGYGLQKNLAVSLASNDWVFVLDSDERITSELKNEITEILKDPFLMVIK
jgi:glycosyltransferase involved in cell wall biosynthesis